jgi:hypothetical protein
MQKKAELNGIPKLVHEYTYNYSNYIYFRWVQQSLILKGSSHFNSAIGCKFPTLLAQCTLRYIPTTCTSTINVTLHVKNFAAFYELVIFCEEVESYAIEHYPNLTYFLESWSSYKKHRFVPLIGHEWMPPSV